MPQLESADRERQCQIPGGNEALPMLICCAKLIFTLESRISIMNEIPFGIPQLIV